MQAAGCVLHGFRRPQCTLLACHGCLLGEWPKLSQLEERKEEEPTSLDQTAGETGRRAGNPRQFLNNFMRFRMWLEQSRPLYFLRTTPSPQNDLKRGWSCHTDGWAYSREEAYQIWNNLRARFNPNLLEPKMDQQYGATDVDGTPMERWCYLVEPGLSAFAFWDDHSFERAKRKLEGYVDSFGPDQILHVFQSDQYKLKSGSDGEDTFLPGIYVCPVRYTDTWDEFVKSAAMHSSIPRR